MDTPKRAILVESASRPGLSNLLEQRSPAMLPIGGKPLIQFWMEWLSDAGFEEVVLLLSHFPEQVREHVGNGERWGLQVSTNLLPEDTDDQMRIQAAARHLDTPSLVADLGLLPQVGLVPWMAEAPSAAGLETGALLPLSLMDGSDPTTIVQHPAAEADFRLITDAHALWRANMELMDGVLNDPNPEGREADTGIYLGFQTRPPQDTRLQGPLRVGAHTLLGKHLQLGPRVSVGSHVIIDEGSALSDCVVMDGTFIGSHAELSQCIVDRRLVIRVDTGVAAYIDDPLILDDVFRKDHARGGLAQRFSALLLLVIVAVPLLLRVVLLSLSGKGAFRRENLELPAGRDMDGSPVLTPLSVTSLNTAHPHWRKLPWLWAAVSGRLPLFGVSLDCCDRGQLPSWARDLATEPPGVITLADLTGASAGDAPDGENVLVTDSYYVATRGLKTHINMTWRWLTGLLRSHDKSPRP
ncbi:MAG: sugar phosphate nucleotidyltransferase [Gammaproteobacteria bacterium]